jgi:hypothetical protein
MLNPALLGAAPKLPPMAVDLDFYADKYVGGTLTGLVQVTRASAGTDLLWTSPVGATYTSYTNNVLRQKAGQGLLSETTRTERFLNSTAPATQTITLTAASTYVVWMNGTGSITVAAGTAVATGFGVCTQGNPLVIVVTGTGTATFTKAGTVDRCSVQNGAPLGVPQSFIETAGAAVTKSTETNSMIDPTIFPQSEGTLLVEWWDAIGSIALATCIFSARVAANNEIRLEKTTGNVLRWFSGSGAGSAFMNAQNAPVANTAYRAALVYKTNDFIYAFSPSLDPNVNSASSGGIPTGTLVSVGLGNIAGSQTFDGVLRRVAWSAKRASRAAIKKWVKGTR